MPGMFDLEITDEMIAALPLDQREGWIKLREQQRAKGAHVADCIKQGDWNQALVLTDSKERAPILIEACEALDIEQARELLIGYWSMTEAWSAIPEQREGMFALIRRLAPVLALADDPRGRPLPPTAGSFPLYRGNLGETPNAGGSWSMEYEIAERFARMAMSPRGMFLGMYREDGVPSIWKGWVEGGDVLAFFDDRHESEIITDRVDGIQLVAQAERSQS